MKNVKRTKTAKTIYQNRLWTNEKTLRFIKRGGTLVIPYHLCSEKFGEAERMGTVTVTKDTLPKYQPVIGKKEYLDKYSQQYYRLVGYRFLPDQLSLF